MGLFTLTRVPLIHIDSMGDEANVRNEVFVTESDVRLAQVFHFYNRLLLIIFFITYGLFFTSSLMLLTCCNSMI
jgi:hypothetical protein